MRDAVVALGAAGGRVIVLDPATGELLAVADVLAGDQSEGSPNQRLARNRCGTDPYEPGSTFKPFVWAAALEAGVVTQEEVLPTPSKGPHRTSRGRRIRDAHYEGPATFSARVGSIAQQRHGDHRRATDRQKNARHRA